MPEGRLQRTRASLPEGYQFGDGGLPLRAGDHITLYDGREYRIGETVQCILDSQNRLVGIRDAEGLRLVTPEVDLRFPFPLADTEILR